MNTKDLERIIKSDSLQDNDDYVLIVKDPHDGSCTEEELKAFKATCKLFGLETAEIEYKGKEDLQLQFAEANLWPAKFIYLSAHGTRQGFGFDHERMYFWPWYELAQAICLGECLRDHGVLLMGCCRGGLMGISADMFHHCPHIDYICGPRWTVDYADLIVGFSVFLYNFDHRNEQPTVAASRASNATNYDFYAYDRVEFEDAQWCKNMGLRAPEISYVVDEETLEISEEE